MKKIGIMQPYFLPHLGYFQLIDMVDEFVIYDKIEFTKNSWIRRNRMLQNGQPEYFSLPIKKDSDYLDVDQRRLADSFEKERGRILRRIQANYRKAPYFKEVFPMVEEIFYYEDYNLFEFIFNSIKIINSYIGITTPIIPFSQLGEDLYGLKGQDLVLGICSKLNTTHYINSIGGMDLYNKKEFKKENIELSFYEVLPFTYPQFHNEFVPFLSILDVCMFNNTDQIKEYLNNYKII